MSGSALNPKTTQSVARFGLFELDLRAGELRKSGVRIKLQDQPLQILTMLLERPGEIVTREELQKRLWPEDTFVDFDLSLNSAVKKLRQALGDDSDNPRFIETLYRRGYRFIGQTNGVVTGQTNGVAPLPTLDPVSLSAAAPSQPQIPSDAQPIVPNRKSHWKLNRRLLALAVPVFLILVVAALWLTRTSPPPRILGYTQITHDGLRKGSILTDGERLYFQELQGDRFGSAQVSVTGGETSVVTFPFQNSFITDIAADGSTVLVASFKGTQGPSPLWSVPLPTGSPQRLNEAAGQHAIWSTDRDKMVFANGSDLYTANANGSQPRKLAAVNGYVGGVRFSPDGRRLRFDVLDPNTGFTTLWEVLADGSRLHPLLPGWNSAPRECCGNWTPDGKHYVFQSHRDGKTNLWLLPERAHWFAPARPIQLTNGPLDFGLPVVSKDGKRIFAVGSQPRAELTSYDGASGFTSYLGGVSVTDVAFSLDSQWVAYVSVAEGTLWRSKTDGSQRLRLTDASMQAALPRWSPDAKQIVFMGQTTTNWRAYVVPTDGGAARDLVPSAPAGFDPGWSPDGKSLVLTLNEGGTPGIPASGPGIAIVELQSQKISLLPGAAQFFSPRWSPDGKFIAALTDDSQKLLLFDRATQKWTDLVNMPIGYPSWSHDGQYIYFDTTLTDDPAFFRVRISDHKLERLISLKTVHRYWGQFGSWTGLGPDDSLLLTRDISSQEIYALDWQQP